MERCTSAWVRSRPGQLQRALPSAVNLYREAVAARPDDPILQYNLAQALDSAGEQTAERAALERAIQLRPRFPEAQNRLGYLSVRAGDEAAAERFFRSALGDSPSYADAAK